MSDNTGTSANQRLFVRWRGKISGPVETSRLLEQLRAGEVTKHHQVSDDRQHWTMLAEHELFKQQCAWKPSQASGSVQRDGESSVQSFDRLHLRGEESGTRDAVSTQWYYVKDESVAGPVDLEQVRRMRSDGELPHDVLLCKEGEDLWRHGAEVLGPPVARVVAAETVAPTSAPVKVPNHLVQSILVTLLCCLPFGIPAIVYSAQVNGKIQAGDIQGAIDSSSKANIWGWISFGVGLVGGVIYGIVEAIGAAAGS